MPDFLHARLAARTAATVAAILLATVMVRQSTATVTAADSPANAAWNPRAAAAYMDGRAAWWTTWPNAARDHGTFCISCHTALPYALARPALRRPLAESGRSGTESQLIDNVVKRVTMWRDVAPFYPDQQRGLPKTSESRGTESILNALVLSGRDAETGHFGDETRAAFANMWALQMKTESLSGAWAWLNFHYEPWESPDAPYFGATLAAIAVGTAPGGYASSPDVQDNLKALGAYLDRQYEQQPLFNQLMALWASARLGGTIPGVLKPDPRAASANDARAKLMGAVFGQQQGDGGWSMTSLGSWKRQDGSALEVRSDGYATGLVTLVMQEAGVSANDARVSRGLDWLRHNQDPTTGQWPAWSLNKKRDPASDAGKFMSDAATAYAVMALTRVAHTGS